MIRVSKSYYVVTLNNLLKPYKERKAEAVAFKEAGFDPSKAYKTKADAEAVAQRARLKGFKVSANEACDFGF